MKERVGVGEAVPERAYFGELAYIFFFENESNFLPCAVLSDKNSGKIRGSQGVARVGYLTLPLGDLMKQTTCS